MVAVEYFGNVLGQGKSKFYFVLSAGGHDTPPSKLILGTQIFVSNLVGLTSGGGTWTIIAFPSIFDSLIEICFKYRAFLLGQKFKNSHRPWTLGRAAAPDLARNESNKET